MSLPIIRRHRRWYHLGLAPKPAIAVPIVTRQVAGALLGEIKARLKSKNGYFKWWKVLLGSCFDYCS